jgi:hypothetical protein
VIFVFSTCRDVLHRCNIHLKYIKHRPPFDAGTAEHLMEFNADVLKISMTNDQYWDLMLLLDWLAAYDELRVSVALEKLVCCELSDELLPPNRLCGFRKHFSDREPCGNFAMYSSLRSAANSSDHPECAGDYCEYRCGVHIDQTSSCHLNQCQPCALFEKQDFTSFIAEDDTLHGPSKPIQMADFTEEPTAIMIADAIFKLCFSDNGNNVSTLGSSLPSGGSLVPDHVSSSFPSPSTAESSVNPEAAYDEPRPAQHAPALASDDFYRVPRHAQAELRAFMEHLGVQYCLNSDCDVYGRPKPATHPLLSSYAIAYLSDIVRCCCLNKATECVVSKSMRGAQRGKPFFGLIAHNVLEKFKEVLKHAPPQKGWLTYFTSWGKTELMSPSKASSSGSSRMAGGVAAEDVVPLAAISGMPPDLNDPEDERADIQHGMSVDGLGYAAWSQQFCFKADILRIEIHLLVHASDNNSSSSPSNDHATTSHPKTLALIFRGPAVEQPAFSLVHYAMQLSDDLSDMASVSSSGRTRLTLGSNDSHRYNSRNVESRTCIMIAEIETSDVSQALMDIYSLERPSEMSQRSSSSNASQSPWHQCPWSENFVPSHFEERNPTECFLFIDQVHFRGQNTADIQESPKLFLSINPRLIVLTPIDLVALSEFFAQPSSVVFNYERKMAIKSRLREGTAAASPPTLEEPTNVVSKNLAKLDISIKLKSPRILIPCQKSTMENISRCVLVIDMASLTINSR